MRLAQRTETFAAAEDQSWLGSAHGTTECDTITLDGSAFLATWADGIVPSGVVLGKITATGLYAPYDNGAADGTEVAAGILFQTVDLGDDGIDSPAALYWHGEVIEAKLPTDHGLDAGARTDLKHIRFVA